MQLLLVDGFAVLYRAFHAIPVLSTSSGQPTNALVGFIRMLQQLRSRCEPTHWAVVFDGGIPASRRALLPEYKAQRPPMPEALRAQLGPVSEYLDAAAVPLMRVEGEEADDVIASVVTAVTGGHDGTVRVASSDKDLYQIVDARVSLVAPAKEGPEMRPADVFAKCGVHPEQIPAWLALLGDSADNIPGVPGVGARTAARLLMDFGTLEGIYAAADTVRPERIRDALLSHRETVYRNLALVTLKRELVMPLKVDALAMRAPDPMRLRTVLTRYELHRLADEAARMDLFG